MIEKRLDLCSREITGKSHLGDLRTGSIAIGFGRRERQTHTHKQSRQRHVWKS